jgi:hypothetical protein
MIRRLTKISPASVLAIVALFAALGGVSYAAGKIGTGQIKNGAVTKKKLHRNAVATAKIRNNAVTGAKVDEATLGIVPDAAALAGKGPAGFESKGFGGEGDGNFVNLPTNTEVVVRSQSLPAGTYLVLARGALNNNDGEESDDGQLCKLSAGDRQQTIVFGGLGPNLKEGDHEEFSLFLVATLSEAGEAVLSCDTNSGWKAGNVTDPAVAAVSLQP